jgi:sec-independent protein translocase protein TatA
MTSGTTPDPPECSCARDGLYTFLTASTLFKALTPGGAMDVGAPELLIVLAVVLLLFGSKKLPELARGIGRASKEFRKGLQESSDTGKDKPPEEKAGG